MANLGQLAQIRGALQGYDTGKMNEQQLQQWLIDFKEKQNQFKQQMGVQQDDLAMRKETHQRRIQDLDLSYKSKKYAMELGEKAGLTEKEIKALAAKWDTDIQQYGLDKTLNKLKERVYGTTKFEEGFMASEQDKARLGKLGVRGLEADVEGKEYETEKKGVESRIAVATEQPQIDLINAEAKNTINTINAMSQTYLGKSLYDAGAMATLQRQLSSNRYIDVQTTGMDLVNQLNQDLRTSGLDVKLSKAELNQINAGIKRLEDMTAQGETKLAQAQFGLETDRMAVEASRSSALSQIGADSTFDASIVNGVRSRVADGMQAIRKNLDDLFSSEIDVDPRFTELAFESERSSITAELNSINEVPVWASDVVEGKGEVRIVLPRLIRVRKMNTEELGRINRGDTAPIWDFPPPSESTYKYIEQTKEEKKKLEESLRAIAPRAGSGTTRTPTTTTGLTPEVRQQYARRFKASEGNDPELLRIKAEFRAKYSAADLKSVIDAVKGM